MNLIRKTFQASETKAVDDAGRTLVVKISTSNPDRSNDVVVADGMQVDNYLRNPVVAAFHRYDQPAIGRTVEIAKSADGIVAKVEFVPAGINPLADQLYEMYKAGFMNAWSIGFIPKKWADLENFGRQFDEWELLEYSAVLVPDNPEALTLLRSKGLDPDKLIKEQSEAEAQSSEALAEEGKDDLPEAASAEAEKPKKEEEKEPEKQEEKPNVEEVGEISNIEVNRDTDEVTLYFSDDKKAVYKIAESMKEGFYQYLESRSKKASDQVVIDLTMVLREADKLIGTALRDAKRKMNGELRTEREDLRVPIAIGQEGVK